MNEDFSNRSGAAMLDQDLGGDDALPYSLNLSKTIHQITWAKSIIGKTKRINTIATSLFGDIKKYTIIIYSN